MSNLTVETVATTAQQRLFIDLPKRLYESSRQWVPPFDVDMRSFLTRRHPYFEDTPSEFFLVRAGDRPVGRAGVFANERYNRQHGINSAHFYFADFEDDAEVSGRLFDTIGNWARQRGKDLLIGPLFSGATNGGGVLIKGFEHRAAMTMMGYNHEYYASHYEARGFTKRFDLLSLSLDPNGFRLPGRIESIADKVRERGRLVVTPLRNKRALKKLADQIADLYNPTLADHTENYPLTDRELEALKKDLLLIAKPELEKVITCDGKVVGYIFTFPDLSEAMQKNGGRLGPLRLLRLLTEGRRTRKVLFNGMGILDKYQRLGGNALLYSELVRSVAGSASQRFDEGEMVQINETTDLMLKDMKNLGAEECKRHRVYERSLV